MVSRGQELKLNKAIDPQALYREIERIVTVHKVSYGDAIIHYCSKSGQEIETVGELIKKNPKMTAAIQDEYEQLNMLPNTARLPV